ncbi:MAG TPA: hypothetical protein VG488_05560 [Candidatus Angelobacter sp.]|jgi:hypothetical protein|nr:hypothetical protein [Candidatus Angelobacter sp.]
MRNRLLTFSLALVTFFPASTLAQTWSGLANRAPFSAGLALLLTNGDVLVQATSNGLGTGQWWILSPDIFGNYTTGTWTQVASFPAGYAPLYYAAAVLPDGRVIIEGGEFNGSSNKGVWTTLGAIYSPANNTWTSVAPPSGWTAIGDAPSVVLPDGTFMLGNCCSAQDALLNAGSLTWNLTGRSGLFNNENGWVLLPNGNVLSVNATSSPSYGIYNPASGTWSVSTNMPQLSVNCEIGPAVLRPDGTVFVSGDNGATAIYNNATGVWTSGPSFPNGLVVADGPAALLPSGNVLVDTSPKPTGNCAPLSYANGSQFFEFNGSSLISVPRPPNASNDPSFVGRMLLLPTGQVLFTDQTSNVEIYTPSGSPQQSWKPTITSVAGTLTPGTTGNLIQGTQFNGLSQGAMYGDDAQMATNYPLIALQNNLTGHVRYLKTHDHSTMAVATGSSPVSTLFDVPSEGLIEGGTSELWVVANGISSVPAIVTVNGCVPSPSCTGTLGSLVTAKITVSCSQSINLTAQAAVCVFLPGSSTASCEARNQSTTGTSVSAQFGITVPSALQSGYCALSWSYGSINDSKKIQIPF